MTTCVQDAAADALLALMKAISEDCYCASWMDGLEFALSMIEGDTPYGQSVVTENQADLLRLMSSECDGWWHWPDDADGPKFISTDDWLRLRQKAEEPKS